jgi:hypothetical protein
LTDTLDRVEWKAIFGVGGVKNRCRTSGFKNDVFISYARVDNEASPDEQGWVSRFAVDLRRELRRRIGLATNEELDIFFDERSLRSNDDLNTLMNNARESATFIAIISPTYVKRHWPREELQAFTGSPNSNGRIFAIEYLPPDTSYPSETERLKHTQFWTQDDNSDTKRPISPGGKSWISKIQDVADDIKLLLRSLADCPGPAN